MRQPRLWPRNAYWIWLGVLCFAGLGVLPFIYHDWVGIRFVAIAVVSFSLFGLLHALYRRSHRRGRRWFSHLDDAFFRSFARFHNELPLPGRPRYCLNCCTSLAPEHVYCVQCGQGPYAGLEGAQGTWIDWKYVPAQTLLIALYGVLWAVAMMLLGTEMHHRVIGGGLLVLQTLDTLHNLSYMLGKRWFVWWDERLPWGWARRLREQEEDSDASLSCERCGRALKYVWYYCPQCGLKRLLQDERPGGAPPPSE